MYKVIRPANASAMVKEVSYHLVMEDVVAGATQMHERVFSAKIENAWEKPMPHEQLISVLLTSAEDELGLITKGILNLYKEIPLYEVEFMLGNLYLSALLFCRRAKIAPIYLFKTEGELRFMPHKQCTTI